MTQAAKDVLLAAPPVLGRGVYTFPDAAKLTGLPVGRVREWFRGPPSRNRKPAFRSDYEPVGGDYAISFWDLLDVFVAGQLREHGVSLATVRKVYDRLSHDLNAAHPFCRREMLSDGKAVFARGLDEHGEHEVSDALTRRKAFPEVILPFLKSIDYDPVTAMAARWHIAAGVVLDPGFSFGRPVVERAKVPTYLLAAAVKADAGDVDLVADWYGLTADEVAAAVRFEAGLSA